MAKVYKTYEQARIKFERADLLLKRPTNWWGKAICIASISEYSHAAMLAARPDCRWCVLDVSERRGGSSHPLKKAIEDADGVWDHFKVNTARFSEFDRENAERVMWKFDACNYGTLQLLRASLVFIPGIRLFQKSEWLCVDDIDCDWCEVCAEQDRFDDQGNKLEPVQLTKRGKAPVPPFCSMAYAIASTIGGGVDPVRHLRNSMTTPGHLAQSHLFTYECTLATADFIAKLPAA